MCKKLCEPKLEGHFEKGMSYVKCTLNARSLTRSSQNLKCSPFTSCAPPFFILYDNYAKKNKKKSRNFSPKTTDLKTD